MLISFTTQQHLAATHGVPQLPSYAVPLAIDCYVIWAVRSRRDVALAVLVSVAANVSGILTAEPLASVDTWVSAGLHAVFPVVNWRMNRPVAAEAPAVTGPVSVDPEPLPVAPVAAEPRPDVEPVKPPSAADVRTVMTSLAADNARPVTGRMLADHFRVSERTGRRYLALAAE
jgi:hypothetical protein